MMDIYTLIRQDHNQIRKLINRINDFSEMRYPDRFLVFRQLRELLMLHMAAEDATFYARLREHPKLKGMIRYSQIEHDEISNMLEALSETDLPPLEWNRKFAEFQNAFLHHLIKEEGELFHISHAVLSREEAIDLARGMETYRQQYLPRKAG